MKKILLLMLSAVAALTSCQKDAGLDGIGIDGMVDVTVAAAMDGASATTRATSTTPGDGTTVDRCILEVYTGGSLYKRMVTSVDQDALSAKFDLRLVSSQEYEFLLWADKGNAGVAVDASGDDAGATNDKYYQTYTSSDNKGLKGIVAKYDNYKGNDETRDAFYYADTKMIDASTVIKAELKRPFGQVNVETDLKDVREDFYPKSVKIKYTTKVYNTFNVLTGDLSGTETAIEWSAAAEVMDDKSDESAPYIDLSTDYLFASADEQNVHNFKMYFYNKSGDEITTNENFKNIPVQRNYRTNISGELLTKQGTINVEIKPAFESSENDVKIEEVATVDAANKVINNATGDVNLKIVDKVSGDSNNVVLPAKKDDSQVENVTVDFSNLDTDTNITIGESSSEVYDGTINVIVSSQEQAKMVTVNAPEAHVTFSGPAGEIISSTSPSTFVVEKGAVVTTLKVEKGNVEIHGSVTTINNISGAEILCMLFDGAKKPEIADNSASIKFITIDPNAAIVNTTTFVAYNSIEEAVKDATKGDVISLSAGTYTLTQDDSKTSSDDPDAYYLYIDKSITIEGKKGEKVIINSEDYTGSNGGNYSKQNLITVKADSVTLRNLEIIANSNQYYIDNYDSYPNKTIELCKNFTDFLVEDCIFKGTTNTKNDAGRLYLGNAGATKAITATVRGCEFYNGAIAAKGKDGVYTIEDCTFDGMHDDHDFRDGPYDGDGINAIGAFNGSTVNVSNCAFSNIEESSYLGSGMLAVPMSAIFTNDGTINVNDCTFPDSGWYFMKAGQGDIFIDGEEYSRPYALINSLRYNTIKDAIAKAKDGDTINLSAGVFTGDFNIDKPLTIIGQNVGVSGLSSERVSESIIVGNITINKGISLTIDGVRMTEESTKSAKIISSDVDGFTFRNNVVDAIGTDLIYFDKPSDNKNITIENNSITGSYSKDKTAIYISNGYNVAIKNNYIADASRGIIIVGYTFNDLITIEGNTFENNSFYNVMFSGSTRSMSVENNIFTGLNTQAASLQLYAVQDNSGDDSKDAVRKINNNTFKQAIRCIQLIAYEYDRSVSPLRDGYKIVEYTRDDELSFDSNVFIFGDEQPSAQQIVTTDSGQGYTCGWEGLPVPFTNNRVEGVVINGKYVNDPKDLIGTDYMIMTGKCQFNFGNDVVLPEIAD